MSSEGKTKWSVELMVLSAITAYLKGRLKGGEQQWYSNAKAVVAGMRNRSI